jgi:hypothetical protein
MHDGVDAANEVHAFVTFPVNAVSCRAVSSFFVHADIILATEYISMRSLLYSSFSFSIVDSSDKSNIYR